MELWDLELGEEPNGVVSGGVGRLRHVGVSEGGWAKTYEALLVSLICAQTYQVGGRGGCLVLLSLFTILHGIWIWLPSCFVRLKQPLT